MKPGISPIAKSILPTSSKYVTPTFAPACLQISEKLERLVVAVHVKTANPPGHCTSRAFSNVRLFSAAAAEAPDNYIISRIVKRYS